MLRFRTLAIFGAATIATIGGPIPLSAQPAPMTTQPVSVSIRLSLQKSNYAIGEKPIAVMTFNEISSDGIWFSNDPYQERIHVTSKDGDPPKTELYRHLLGDFPSGDGPALLTGPVVGRFIAPGAADSEKYDLTGYYDLGRPGDYSVYLEIYDPAGPKDRPGHWLRTNTVTFKIQALGDSQVALPVSHSDAIAVSLRMENNRLSVGHEVKAIFTMNNIGGGVAIETGDPRDYRLYVEGETGEPPKTLWHRRLLGEPGLAPLTETVSAFPEKLLPGWSTDRTFLLSAFYDLRIPGKYTVYVEVRDQSGTWLRPKSTPRSRKVVRKSSMALDHVFR
jgi:hypothetical protein